jgi:hypothetical protein
MVPVLLITYRYMFHTLIPNSLFSFFFSEGNLLKEAVRRLQLGLTPKIQRSFYDSDEDCRTPPTTNNFTELREIGIN